MYKTIVAGTDGSATANEAIKAAGELARSFGAHLHLVSAYQTPSTFAMATPEAGALGMIPGSGGDWEQEVVRHTEGLLGALRDEIAGDGTVEVTTHAVGGDAAEVILDLAKEKQADLIVVGNRGMTGARRFLLGSVPDRIAHHAPCSVLIVNTSD